MVKNEVFGDFPPYQRLICVPKRAFFRLGGRPSAQTPPGGVPPPGTPPGGGPGPPPGTPPGGVPPGGVKNPKNLEIVDILPYILVFYTLTQENKDENQLQNMTSECNRKT